MIPCQGLLGVFGAPPAPRRLFSPLAVAAHIHLACPSLPSQPLPQAVPASSSNLGAQNVTKAPVKIPEGTVLLPALLVVKASVWGHEVTFLGFSSFPKSLEWACHLVNREGMCCLCG